MTRSLTRKLAAIEPGTLFVGVDLGKDKHVAVMLNQQAEQIGRFSISNDGEGFERLCQEMKQVGQRIKAPAVMVGMEPTNYLWKPLAKYLTEKGVTYRLVNAYTVKKHREGNNLDSSKDDRRDAFVIAELLRTGKFTETQQLTGLYAELRQYTWLYVRLQKEISQQKTLIHAAVGQLFPELRTVFKDLTGQTVSAMLKEHAAPATIAALPVNQFIQRVRAGYTGRRLEVSKLRRAHAMARNSVGLEETEALQLSVRCHLEQLELLRNQRDTTRQRLQQTLLALPEAPYLLSLGLGVHTTAILLGEIGNPRCYLRGNQLVKLAGTQPTPNLSGQKRRSKTPMSRKGRPRLRSALFFACMRLVKNDPGFKQLHYQLQTRSHNPLQKMESIGVLMNKVLRVMWALMQQQTFYEPERLLVN